MAGIEISEAPRQRFADDIVGRFRSGHTINDRPASLEEWRVTTGDPEVAAKIYELLGGEEPQEWAARGEDNLEVFTASSSVDIIIESAKSLRQRMVLRGEPGRPLYVALDARARGTGADEGTPARLVSVVPDIDLFFRLADDKDLGIFQFKTGAWGLARDLAAEDVAGQLEAAEGPVKATLTLEPVSFIAKNGPMKGKTVSYTQSGLKLKGAA